MEEETGSTISSYHPIKRNQKHSQSFASDTVFEYRPSMTLF